MSDLKYPIGTFTYDPSADFKEINSWISDIDHLPDALAEVAVDLTENQLDTPYRPDGWTIRQVVHHLADSHINAYIRTKLILTEKEPQIKTWEEQSWAELRDNDLPVEPSLQILRGTHKRWVRVLEFVEPEEWEQVLIHPENGKMTLKKVTSMYAWHGNHHLAHITSLIERKNW